MKSVGHLGFHTYQCLLCHRGYSRKDDLYGHLTNLHMVQPSDLESNWGLTKKTIPLGETNHTTTTWEEPVGPSSQPQGEVILSLDDGIQCITTLDGTLVDVPTNMPILVQSDLVPTLLATTEMASTYEPEDLSLDPTDLIKLAATQSNILEEDNFSYTM